MSQVTEIQALQELDDEAASRQSRLDEIERGLAGDEALEGARARLAEASAVVVPLHKEEVKSDGELKVLVSKIGAEDKKLYSGTVTSSKELRNLQHEVESLKSHRSAVEDTLLDLEVKLEAARAAETEARDALTALETKRAASVQSWSAEAEGLKRALAALDARRVAQRAKLLPRALVIYDRVRDRRGSAIARVQGNTCMACRVSMPDSVRKQAFNQDALTQCPNCERILYLG